ncbi:MAG: DUF1418 family protein [Pseudomonadales bacterium]
MPKPIVVIDYFGCVLVALAVFEIANENKLIPPAWQLPYHPHSMLVLGVLLVLPMVIVAILRARRELELRQIASDTAAALKANKRKD